MEKMTRTYTNNTTNYQLVGNHETVIASGTETEVTKVYNDFDVKGSKYGCVSIVEPGETITGNYIKNDYKAANINSTGLEWQL